MTAHGGDDTSHVQGTKLTGDERVLKMTQLRRRDNANEAMRKRTIGRAMKSQGGEGRAAGKHSVNVRVMKADRTSRGVGGGRETIGRRADDRQDSWHAMGGMDN